MGDSLVNDGWMGDSLVNDGWIWDSLVNDGWMGDSLVNDGWMGDALVNDGWMGDFLLNYVLWTRCCTLACTYSLFYCPFFLYLLAFGLGGIVRVLILMS